jgi:two-component system KDP operon response regulator KdpE
VKFLQKLRVLSIINNFTLATSLRLTFEQEGFEVVQSEKDGDLVEHFFEVNADAIILDYDTVDEDTVRRLEVLRTMTFAPLVVFTEQQDESVILYLFHLGADDCLRKPFGPRELASRVKALLRRIRWTTAIPGDAAVRVDDRLRVDFNRCEVISDGIHFRLSATEQRLLHLLMQNAGWSVPHSKLLRFVWGHEDLEYAHYVRLYVNYLRAKIEKDPSQPHYILSERGYCYRFIDFLQIGE